MALKTAVRRLCTWLPLSVEMARAVEADERVIDAAGDDLIIDLGPDDVVDMDETAADAAAQEAGAASDDGPPSGSAPEGVAVDGSSNFHKAAGAEEFGTPVGADIGPATVGRALMQGRREGLVQPAVSDHRDSSTT